jgi:hypothetical protein
MRRDVFNILLQITGSSADAQRELAEVAGELAAFDKQDAEATADVNTLKAQGKLAKLRFELARLASDKINIRVDEKTNRDLEGLSSRGHRATQQFVALLDVLFKFAPIVAGFGGQIVALAGTLFSAAKTTGGLAVAIGADIPAAILLAVGAMRNWKNHSDDAGTAANDLKKALGDLGNTFDRMMRTPTDRIFTGMSDAIPDLQSLLRQLGPDFNKLGSAVRDFIRQTTDFLTSAKNADFFKLAIQNLTDLINGPAGAAFRDIFRILRNIAEAAFPVLIQAAEDFDQSLKGMSDRTADVEGLSGVFKRGYKDLKTWLDLAYQGGRIFTGLFQSSLPDGRSLLKTMDDGARKLADWLRTAEGRNAVKDFFDAVIPVADHVFTIAGKLVDLFLKWSELVAPIFDPILTALGKVIDAAGKLLDWLNKLPGPLDDVAAALALLFGPKIIGGIITLGRTLVANLGAAALGKVIGSVGNLGTAVGDTGVIMTNMSTRSIPMLIGKLGALGLALYAGWEAFQAGIPVGHKLADSMTNTISPAAVKFQQTIGTVARQVGNSFGAVTKTAQAMANGIGSKVMPDLVTAVKGGFEDFVKAITSTGPKAKSAAQTVGKLAVGAVKALTGDFNAAGKDWIDALSSGTKSKEGAAKNASSGVARAAKIAAAAFGVEFNDVGKDHGDRYAGGLEGKSPAAKNSGSAVARAAKQAINDLAGDFNSAGGTHGDRYSGGVSGKTNVAGSAGGALAKAAHDALDDYDFSTPGANAGDAFGRGLNSVKQALITTANSVGAAIGQAMSKSAQDNFTMPSGGGGGGGNNKTSGKLGTDTVQKAAFDAVNDIAKQVTSQLRIAVASVPVVMAPVSLPVPVLAGATGDTQQVFNIPAAPAAHGQPDPRHTAAQLGILLRSRGGAR